MVRWGILGAGNIARRFAASLTNDPRCKLVALSSRTREGVERALADTGALRGYVSHDELLGDPEVDAVYLSLPHGLHREWTVRALRAGKAVLLEKPAGLTADEVREMASVAHEEDVLLMEGMKARFSPAFTAVRHLVGEGVVGELVTVETSLCNDMAANIERRGSYHVQPGQGGVLLDCGIYCASWLDAFTPECASPHVESVTSRLVNGIDYYVDALLTADALSLRLECAFDRQKPREAILAGTRGSVVVHDLHRSQGYLLRLTGGGRKEVETPFEVDDFFGEIGHFTDLLEAGRTESDIVSLESSIRCADLLDRVRARLQEPSREAERRP